jgi:exopolysaccharide biosynthesis polyprenyl glycosylphosphotransferase
VSVQETFDQAVLAPAIRSAAPSSLPWLKRSLDFGAASAALVAVLPLFLVLAILIKLDSRGPVLFRQSRTGLAGRPFTILKFRTMRVLEEGDRVVQAAQDDPRVTRVGRFLRTWSIDELPQLLNVLAGDMSLVGPRPHACAHDIAFAQLVTHYAARRSVKPGLTGWAQINGLRGPVATLDSLRHRSDLDVWYARNASVALDLRILLRTPREVLRRRNAF